MPFIDISTGARLHYVQQRPDRPITAPPVVLLHGLLGTGTDHFESVIDWLVKDSYEVIAPTLRGYGQSTPHPRDFPDRFYDRDAADILAFLDALGLDKVHLLGYSDGGEVALIMAGQRPQCIATLAVIGSIGYFGETMREVVAGYRPGSEWIEPDEIGQHRIPDPDAFASDWQRSVLAMIDAGGDIALRHAPRITAPTLIMLGKQDTLNPSAYAQRFLDRINGAGYLEVFACGHPVHKDKPAQFRAVYTAHLQRSANSPSDTA